MHDAEDPITWVSTTPTILITHTELSRLLFTSFIVFELPLLWYAIS